ncbi:hypothetical protein [Rhizobium rhizogenes]|uniref:hypothetical protein n=1 Tax=Rhizobium rhizogenes TaxID=359 RepID=UPI0022C3D665|nr:hypothetical protein [Rhizobium rhizogenes]MCZ7486121.1 hypothetical protein [Rhizobium rhizogenes]
MNMTVGGKTRKETAEEHARRVREQATGGFPAGALSECLGLPEEATCGLLAASGFNPCLDEVNDGRRTPDNCFGIYKNHSGVRACDPAHPCRDDYICLSPMGYSLENAKTKFNERAKRCEDARMSVKESTHNRKRLASIFSAKRYPIRTGSAETTAQATKEVSASHRISFSSLKRTDTRFRRNSCRSHDAACREHYWRVFHGDRQELRCRDAGLPSRAS